MPKRKSGGGENEAEKKTNTKRLSAQQLEKFPRVPKMGIFRRLTETVSPAGGPDAYLEQVYDTKASQRCCFVAGGLWYRMFVQQMFARKFLSNPDQPGCEKLAVRKIPKEFLEREYFEMEWESSNSIAKAFRIGRAESQAVSNLMCKIPKPAVDYLEKSVKSRGMNRYLSHEVIGRDLLNASFTCGFAALEHWREELRNTDDVACTYQQALAKLQCCSGFIHFLKLFERISPAGDYKEAEQSLKSQFFSGYLDPDISHALETQPFVARVEKAQRDARESKEQELERNAREADFKSIMAKIESDMEILENRFSDKGESALAHARDLKYIRDRQKKGQDFVSDWMGKHCCLIAADENYSNVVNGFLKFKEQYRGRPGKEFVVVGFDTTVWPANATVVTQATSTMSQLLTMSNSNVAFVQYPILQSQTNPSAVLKHKHLLESSFLKASMTLNNTVQVLFSKPGSRWQAVVSNLPGSVSQQLYRGCLGRFERDPRRLYRPLPFGSNS
ncbi:Uncharacterized protein SCF082_LOCUS30979 [Durusdinium trenchii]|uniref:Uncharacterized protein n=1 Tax=Durusdinium trenchii TaxID=1381693 RepID=A0ABP0N394_9DINO